MRTLVKHGTVLTLNPQDELLPRADILIDDGEIIAVGGDLSANLPVDRVFDADQKLVMPGWVNADLHASEVLFKGCFENTPLDCRPFYTRLVGCESPELVYDSALVSGIAMLKSGVTTVQDHWLFPLAVSLKQVEAALQAYQSLGLRTTLALGSSQGFLEERHATVLNALPASLKSQLAEDLEYPQKLMPALQEAVELWHLKPGSLVRLALAPGLRQIADPQIRRELMQLADERQLGLHFHFDETKQHALTFDGHKTLTQAAEEMGLLGPRTSISHATWLTPADMDLLAKYQATCIHTPLSDLYAGSGILPLHHLNGRGLPIAIGFGFGSGAADNYFDAIKMVGSIQRIVQPNYSKWPGVKRLLDMGIQAGAKASQWVGQIGQVAPGYRADLVFYDLNRLAFTPLNELVFQLIYLEDGSSIEAVMVDGKFLVQNGKVISVDEQEAFDRFSAAQENYEIQRQSYDLFESQLAPYQLEAYKRTVSQPYAVHRWANHSVQLTKLKKTFPYEGEQHVDSD